MLLFSRNISLVLGFLVLVPSTVGFGLIRKEESQRVLRTKLGDIKGVRITFGSDALPPVDAYLGIQYASADLRFMPPKTGYGWSGVKQANHFGPVCPQRVLTSEDLQRRTENWANLYLAMQPYLEKQEEDCLYLNLYVPDVEMNSTLLPVVMFIHGDGYDIGSGNAYDGSVLASFGRVIVITLNFRLGALGFVSTEDNAALGNYGLLDQLAALHWLRKYVSDFGGNPEEVAVMGAGAGACMVHLLMASKLSKPDNRPLFKRAIIQGGSADATWSLSKSALRDTIKLAQLVNCTAENRQRMMDCLKKAPVEALLEASRSISSPLYYSSFAPVADAVTVPRPLRSRLLDPDYQFDMLFGVATNEGFNYFDRDDIVNGIPVEKKEKILRTLVRNVFDFQRTKIYHVLEHHYTDYVYQQDARTIRDSLMELVGDQQILVPLMELAEAQHKLKQRAYFYVFNYPTSVGLYPEWAKGVHGEELMYLLGAPLVDGTDMYPFNFTKSEKMVSEAMMRYWTNFIKSGDPNKPIAQTSVHGGRVKNKYGRVTWPQYDVWQQHYLKIALAPRIRSHYKSHKVALFLDLIPKIHKDDELDTQLHHLLPRFNDSSSYHGAVRPVDVLNVLPPPAPPPAPPAPPPRLVTGKRPDSLEGEVTSVQYTVSTSYSPITTGSVSTGSTALSESVASSKVKLNPKTTLSVIIAVGVSLLVLNVFVCAAIFYQREKMRHEKQQEKLRQQQDLQESQEGKDKSIHLVGSSNGSSRYHTDPTDIQLIQRPNGTSPKKQRHSKRDILSDDECEKLRKFGSPTELSV